MKTRTLGNTGIELTAIGLGTWAHGGGDWVFSWGAQDDEASKQTIFAALDAGINWIDCAAVYGLGHSEVVLGKALREIPKSERPFVTSKCGRNWRENGSVYGRLTAESVRRECEDSLRRLRVDVIDLYQIHWPDPDPEIEEGWTEIGKLIADGKVRYAGVSNFNVDQMRRCQAIRPIASLQPPYSMLKRGIEAAEIAYCRENGIGIIAYSPMQKGLLTGKITAERIAQLPPDDHRHRDPMFNEPRLSEILARVEQLKPIAADCGCTLAQLALAWVLRLPEITAAIVGGRRPEQIRETAQAAEVELSAETIQRFEHILSA